MLKFPNKNENVDKKFLKSMICFIIDTYYETDNKVYCNNQLISDNVTIDMTTQDLVITIKDSHHPEYPIEYKDHEHIISNIINHEGISFAAALQRFIQASGFTNAEVYSRARVSRQTFSRIIRNNTGVTKKIALALAAALELSISQTNTLLSKAGLSFSSSNQDLIIQYCFNAGIYDVDKINLILNNFHEELIGTEDINQD